MKTKNFIWVFITTLTLVFVACKGEDKYYFKMDSFEVKAENLTTGNVAITPMTIDAPRGNSEVKLSNMLEAVPGEIVRFTCVIPEDVEQITVSFPDKSEITINQKNKSYDWTVPEYENGGGISFKGMDIEFSAILAEHEESVHKIRLYDSHIFVRHP